MNLRPHRSERCALPNCAIPRQYSSTLGGIRTHNPQGHCVLSAACIPFHHECKSLRVSHEGTGYPTLPRDAYPYTDPPILSRVPKGTIYQGRQPCRHIKPPGHDPGYLTSALDGTRTRTGLRPPRSQHGLSTNSNTNALSLLAPRCSGGLVRAQGFEPWNPEGTVLQTVCVGRLHKRA